MTRKQPLRNAAPRALLYIGASLLVWGGARWHTSLEREAAAALAAPPALSVIGSGTLGKDRLHDVLVRAGSSPQEAFQVSQALDRRFPVRQLTPLDRWLVVRSTSGAFMHLTVSRGLTRWVVAPGGQGFKAFRQEAAVTTVARSSTGTLRDSLWVSMQGVGVPAWVIAEYSDVFQWTVDFLTEPRSGDRFSVSWLERRSPDGRLVGAEIQTALYQGRVTGRQTGVRFEGEYYDEKGDSLKRMFLRAPLNFRRISSTFTLRRFHPILRSYRPHHGIDYAAPRGTPVVSVAEGKVTFVGFNGATGNAVEVRHNGVFTTLYGHLSGFAKGIRAGSRVQQGEVVGFVGSTGLSTGPHLHFQIEKNGALVNFLKLNLPFSRSVPRDRLDEFRTLRDRGLADLLGTVASAGVSP